MNQMLLKKYAKLAVVTGVNVQKDQQVIIRATTETKDLVRELVEQSYLAGASKVTVRWGDDFVSKSNYQYMTTEALEDVPSWLIDQSRSFVDAGACSISVTSPIPGLNKDLDPVKMQKAGIANQKALSFFQSHYMGNKSQWTVIAYPNSYWAKQVFPDLDEKHAVQKLWDSILVASRVTKDNDPVKEWQDHDQMLEKHNVILNQFQFKTLHFSNSIGTKLTVELVENHIWAGGGERSTTGVYFNPNIPTEESFTMPHKFGTDGIVYATKPLNYQGKLIEDFWLEFKNGKVINYGAKKEVEALKSLIEFDEGSSYIGEIALISYDSPISNSNILFLNTLFDENASCHMALGRAYPMNVKNGNDLSQEELQKVGYNYSMSHSDFMFGSSDLEVVGVMHDGKKVLVFKNGNFVI
jgi:aminopeptidase